MCSPRVACACWQPETGSGHHRCCSGAPRGAVVERHAKKTHGFANSWTSWISWIRWTSSILSQISEIWGMSPFKILPKWDPKRVDPSPVNHAGKIFRDAEIPSSRVWPIPTSKRRYTNDHSSSLLNWPTGTGKQGSDTRNSRKFSWPLHNEYTKWLKIT